VYTKGLLFPVEIIEYFDLLNVEEVAGIFNFHLEELNLAPTGYLQEQLESEGFNTKSWGSNKFITFA
jgi:hypothetical protein